MHSASEEDFVSSSSPPPSSLSPSPSSPSSSWRMAVVLARVFEARVGAAAQLISKQCPPKAFHHHQHHHRHHHHYHEKWHGRSQCVEIRVCFRAKRELSGNILASSIPTHHLGIWTTFTVFRFTCSGHATWQHKTMTTKRGFNNGFWLQWNICVWLRRSVCIVYSTVGPGQLVAIGGHVWAEMMW